MVQVRYRSLRKRFPAETSYVDANWDWLTGKYPNRSLVIEGEKVIRVFETIEELIEAWVNEEALRRSFICSTHKLPPLHPLRPLIVPRA